MKIINNQQSLFPYLNHEGKFSPAYGSEFSVGLQHHILIETFLGSIQKRPLILSEANVHIIIGH